MKGGHIANKFQDRDSSLHKMFTEEPYVKCIFKIFAIKFDNREGENEFAME